MNNGDKLVNKEVIFTLKTYSCQKIYNKKEKINSRRKLRDQNENQTTNKNKKKKIPG